MISSVVTSKKSKPLLNELQTKEFISEMDLICKNVDFKKLLLLIANYSIIKTTDVIDFINQGKEMFEGINNPLKGIELISTETLESKCLFCSIGKTVKVYSVKFSKQEENFKIIYSNNFAINIEIEDKMLVDFGWCNAFLDKSEMEQL